MEDGYILIVDDDQSVCSLLTDALNLMNLKSRAVHNGEDALVEVRGDPPKGIILDLMMPIMDGFATLKHLRDDPVGKNIPVIVMSAIADDRRMTSLPGVRGVLRKGSFTLSGFREVMENAGLIPTDA